MEFSNAIIVICLAFLVLLICRSMVVWWTGISDVIRELKEIKTELKKGINHGK